MEEDGGIQLNLSTAPVGQQFRKPKEIRRERVRILSVRYQGTGIYD